MRLKFFSHLFMMVLLNLLVKPLAIFGIDAEVQNSVGAEEYGFYFSLLNFTYLFNILLDFGITNFNTKYIAQHPHLAKQYLGKILPLRLVLFVCYVLFTCILAWFLGYGQEQYQLIWILIFNQFLVSVIFYFRSYFSGLLMLKTEILLSVMDKVLLILFAGYFLYLQDEVEMTVLLFVQIQTATYFLTLLFAFVLILFKVGIPQLKWNPSFCRLIIKKSFPYALLIVLMTLYNRVDSVMIERLLPNGDKEAGIYAQAYRILDAFFMFASLFSSLLFPIFATMLKKRLPVIDLVDSTSRILISGAIVLALICLFHSEWLMRLIYEHNISSSSQVFKYLMFSFIPICITLIFGTLLTANGNLKFLNTISFIGILLNVGLNFIFIPKYGALGATITSLSTQSVVALVQLIYALKHFHFSFRLKGLMRYLGLAVLLIPCGLYIDLDQGHLLNLILFSGIALVYCLATNMIQWKLLVELLKRKSA